jgi:non-ribosomal peptide synthase protein (TIGR01720 family)
MAMPWHEVHRLPNDHEVGARRNTNGSAASLFVELDPLETRALLAGRRRPAHVIITALGQALSTWTSSPTILLDVLSHGRDATLEGVNLSRTVGFTLSYNPLVLSHLAWDDTSGAFEAVTRQVEDAPEGFTFELLRFLASDGELRARLSDLPRADVLFNYAGAEADIAEASLWRPASDPTGAEESPRGLRQYPIAVRATLRPNLRLTFVYSTELHDRATIEAKAAEVSAAIRELLEPPALVAP